MPKITKLLAANRSEIAIRIFRSATTWGASIYAPDTFIWLPDQKFQLPDRHAIRRIA
jgi:hypothetical protein